MDEKELVNKISYLISKKNHDQAYAIIREFEKNSNYEMICVSAQGFINAYHYRSALKILESIKKKYSKNAEFCACYAIALFNSEKEDKSLQWFEKTKEKGLENLSEISNNFFSKTIDDWIKKAKFWGAFRIEENKYKEEL
ncbi:Uncharacterised protein [Fusobacterium polymorphum]|uniref:Uncharacterized protein n=1 Tax=Fusobacterium polymorphum ATCC 10953 TaxID=393480 RepID=A5TTM2_FUSNP|nr:hypothetical protein [Fusobacterium polymorphum]EDK88247.1 hypothetical protein FNP_0437 [Fusobacterium polymorphum ATCC 10953]UTI53821.1 hypothetical protein NLJ26_04230 [Fusobacterium polymorphum]WRL68360.1 hypothetical protein VKN78_11255 [Fusobacterium polymorphum]CKG82434.1 Uncharacterised protein [Fusobacterium polymorphum]